MDVVITIDSSWHGSDAYYRLVEWLKQGRLPATPFIPNIRFRVNTAKGETIPEKDIGKMTLGMLGTWETIKGELPKTDPTEFPADHRHNKECKACRNYIVGSRFDC